MTTTESSGAVAIITGAGSGLGRVFTRELAAAGLRVVALGRREEALRETLVRVDPARAATAVVDVTDPVAVDRAFRDVATRWGRVDVLINNAGTFGPTGEIADVGLDEVRATLEVNLIGALHCARSAWAIMREQDPPGGRIINNGSISAHVPRPLAAAYTISKHAITGLTKSLALDGRPHGITCGQIDIGNARTSMTGMVVESALQADGTRRIEPTFDARTAARAIVYMATLPPEATVGSLTLTATAMPFEGRG